MGLLTFKRACLLLGLALASCDTLPNEWTAWVYRDASDLTQSVKLTGFKSFEDCQQSAINTLRSYPDPDAGDYECGFKCAYDADMQTNICKETRK